MAFNVTVTPQVQEVEVSATVQPYEVQVEVIDSPILDLTTNGTSGDATFDPFTGVLNIPNYTTDLSGVVPTSRTLTINGTSFDLSANRSWTVGDLLSSGSYSNPSWITSLGWNKISSTPTTLAGYGITDAQPTLSLTTTGSSGASTLVGATLNIPNYTLSGLGGIGGSIASGQVAFGSGTNTVEGSNNLFWDNANGRLGIGTNSPDSTLTLGSSTSILNTKLNINSSGRADIELRTSGSSNVALSLYAIGGNFGSNYSQIGTNDGVNSSSQGGAIYFDSRTGTAPPLRLMVKGTGTTAMSNALSVFNTKNIAINTTTDSGFRLDVNGTARIQGNLTTNISAGQVMFAGTGGVLSGSNNLFWDSANGRLGIGTNSPSFDLSVQRTINDTYAAVNIRNLSSGNGATTVFRAQDNSTGVCEFGLASTGHSTLANVGYFFTSKSILDFYANSGNRLRIYGSTGNVLIQNGGTFTDAGFRLDVNGTARVQGDFTISDTRNIILATGTGTKIGTATSQKLSLWNATPNVQPTTAITASAFIANTSGIANDTATFDGYTIGQVVAALRRIGALA